MHETQHFSFFILADVAVFTFGSKMEELAEEICFYTKQNIQRPIS